MIGMEPVSGGDIHRSYKVVLDNGDTLFAKLNEGKHAAVLAGEYRSLCLMIELGVGGYPRAVSFVQNNGAAVLLMEYLQLTSMSGQSGADLAEALYRQHAITSKQYGWAEDNHIGLSPQLNGFMDSWIEFYRDRRLLPQLEWAVARGLPARSAQRVERLMTNLPEFINEGSIKPALLHGDLWGGNVAVNRSTGQPVLYDPAPYFGDAEADLAMTRLFGGFPASFYAEYDSRSKPKPGRETRVRIYNLYHALNHFNLFGAGYQGLVDSCADIQGVE